MKNIVILSNDARTVSQITSRVSELNEETMLEVFRTLEDFDRFIGPTEVVAPAKDPKVPVVVSDEKKQSMYVQALFKEKGLHLIIVDQEILGKASPVLFIQTLNNKLAGSEINKEAIATRFILLSFDANANSIETLASSQIDDIILKPLDNQLFLQKLSMVVSDKRTSAGEFLYKQAVDANIYVAKSSKIEELSDFGFSVRSKKKVKDGVIVRIYAKVFGEKIDSSLFVRTYKSLPHPTALGEFRVYYTYYGITAGQLQKVRRALHGKSRRGTPTKAISKDEILIFKKNPRNIAIVAFNGQIRADIENALGSNFINLSINSFPSLISFAKKMGVLQPKVGATEDANGMASLAGNEAARAFASATYIFNINHADEIINLTNKGTAFFDQSGPQMISQPKKWLQFIHPDDLDELQEFLNYLKSNEKGSIFIRLRGPFGSLHFVKIDASELAGAKPPQIQIQMSELKGPEGFKIFKAARPDFDSQGVVTPVDAILIDAILIDASGITQTVESWALHVKSFLENVKILTPERKTAVIVLLPEKSLVKLEDFKKTFFSDIMFVPVDRKQMIDKINFHVHGLCSNDGIVTPGFDAVNEVVKLAQEVKMEMASEFGVQIRTNQPIREGVFLRLFSPLFLDENYDGILARSYSAEVDEKNKNEFHNVFSFYGISDAFLKHIRKWIRETHIAQKDPKE